MTDPVTLWITSKAQQPLMAAVLSILFFIEEKFKQGFPEIIKKLWNEWELRVMVLLSLILQIILITRGRGRKYITENRIKILLWCAYLMAEWVATFALGVLAKLEGKEICNKDQSPLDPNDQLKAFWAPFLLLHLGGPDTISAYSLEDNELWLRHLLGLIVQSAVVFYVFLKAWNGNNLFSILSIPMFLAGMIKYGERTWVLRSMSSEKFRDSMLPPPDPGPNYPKFTEQYRFQKVEGFIVSTGEVIEAPDVIDSSSSVPDESDIDADTRTLVKAYDFFSRFKRLFVDLILSFHDRNRSRSFFQNKSSKEAFEVIEIELGFMYDVLFTKATVNYTLKGYFFRCISLSFTVVVFILFVIAEKQKYSIIDQIITFLLLFGAIVLEIYAVILLLSSDWTDLWLSKHKKTSIVQVFSCFQLPSKPRWSKTVAQYSLLTFCLKEKPAKCPRTQKFFCIYEMLERHRYNTYSDVTDELEELIFQDLNKKSSSDMDLQALCTCRGGNALENYNKFGKYKWSIDVEFDQSILLWHIATELCYYSDFGELQSTVEEAAKTSKTISDYMLYLLVMCPFMLPNGIGMIRFRDTCAEAMEFFQERKSLFSGGTQARMMLLQVNTEVPTIIVKGDRSKSVLFDACILTKLLSKEDNSWEIISHVWVEMLSYAASHCRGNYHAQQLRQGGELLTHVWLLMAHLGITEQFQISQGHARAKLIMR